MIRTPDYLVIHISMIIFEACSSHFYFYHFLLLCFYICLVNNKLTFFSAAKINYRIIDCISLAETTIDEFSKSIGKKFYITKRSMSLLRVKNIYNFTIHLFCNAALKM